MRSHDLYEQTFSSAYYTGGWTRDANVLFSFGGRWIAGVVSIAGFGVVGVADFLLLALGAAVGGVFTRLSQSSCERVLVFGKLVY